MDRVLLQMPDQQVFFSVQAAVSLIAASVYSLIAYSNYDGPTTGLFLQHGWSGEE